MRNEVIDKLNTLIIAAFGLVAALAWNSAIQAIFKQFFGETAGVLAMIGYAIVVTVVAVIVTVHLVKVTEKVKK